MARSTKNSSMLAQLTKTPLAILGIGVLLLGILVSLFLIQRNQELRQRATTPSGTAVISTDPAPGTIQNSSQQTINLNVNMGVPQVNLDGIQLIASITGDVPSDLTFTPATISGLSVINENQILVDSSSGKDLTLIFLTSNPSAPFVGDNQTLNLGQFSFTAPASGNFSITFDPQFSKINQTQTGNDILQTPSVFSYTFSDQGNISNVCSLEFTINAQCNSTCTTDSDCLSGHVCYDTGTETVCRLAENPSSEVCQPASATSTPTPTPTATPTSTPTSTPTNTPSPTPGTGGNTPTPTPSPTNTPSPSPTNTPSPTPVPECNLSCSTNDDCPNNHICYNTGSDTVCRLSTNPTNESCLAATPTPTPSPTPSPAPGCNDNCSSNADCSGTDHICYNTGSDTVCRLASNPNNESCAAATASPTPTSTAQPNLPESGGIGFTSIVVAVGVIVLLLGILAVMLLL